MDMLLSSHSSGTQIQAELPEDGLWDAVVDPANYIVEAGTAPPIAITTITFVPQTLQTGSLASLVGDRIVALQEGVLTPTVVGRYLTVGGDTVRILSASGSMPMTVELDRPLPLSLTMAGPIPWTLLAGAQQLTLQTSGKLQRGATYRVRANLRNLAGMPVLLQGAVQANAPAPQVQQVEFLSRFGQVKVTFSDPMRPDRALTDPAEYMFSGPTPVRVTRVNWIGTREVVLSTTGFSDGDYTLTVNATGTPKDEVGNPIDPLYNQAIFTATPSIMARSLFVDKGPIARPPLVLGAGTGITLINPNTLGLTGGLLTTQHIGKYLTLAGTDHCDGEFQITAVLSPTQCRVKASFTLPDAQQGAAVWTLKDLRNGQIADDPAHVTVRINAVPVVPEAVIGLLGQIVLPSVPLSGDVVEVDYCWICNPTVDVQRYNSLEFRYNSWDRNMAPPPGAPTHQYRYNNVLVRPSDYTAPAVVQSGTNATVTAPDAVTLPAASIQPEFVGLTLLLGGVNAGTPFRIETVVDSTHVTVSPNPAVASGMTWTVEDQQGVVLAPLAQPLLRDLKYRAYERAYTVLWNDPTTLTWNAPHHKVAYPPLSRYLDEVSASYVPATLPELDPTNPWTRRGQGIVTIVSNRLQVQDNTTGPYPTGQPIFWTRPADYTFSHVFAMAWQMQVSTVTTTQGVWTGWAGGFADSERAFVLGLLLDGTTAKLGILKAGYGNDPSTLAAWTGGLATIDMPTYAPIEVDWTQLHTYRVLRSQNGIIRVYLDGEVVEALRVLPEELPFLEELNAPFDQIQDVFFGAFSREASGASLWDFVQYTIIPTNPIQTAPTVFVTYQATDKPEVSDPLWTPLGYHGTETIIASNQLLLDSTSATDQATETQVGLVGGDFRGFMRLEPLLSAVSDMVVDFGVSVVSSTHGPANPNGVFLAVDDAYRLIQVCFIPHRSSPKISYGGRSLPTDWTPTPWQTGGSASVQMVGRTLRITDASTSDGRVYYQQDVEALASPSRVLGAFDVVLEARVSVLSFTPDIGGFCGAQMDVYDGLRAWGVMWTQTLGVPYLTFHSDGVPISSVAVAWDDQQPHTVRLTKNLLADLVTLTVDGVFVGSEAYSSFTAPGAGTTGVVAFGSSTTASMGAQSVTEWMYCNTWRVLDPSHRFVGIWKGALHGDLTDYHLPTKVQALLPTGQLAGNALGDTTVDFVTQGVVAGDMLLIDDGVNQGVYEIASVAANVVTVTGVFTGPLMSAYRIARETDWSQPHGYRLSRNGTGEVALLLDSDTTPSVTVTYNELELPASSAGVPYQVAYGLPSITWGAMDPTNLSQALWTHVKYGLSRRVTEQRIAPHHQVWNQRNVMSSPEHLTAAVPHTHTDFWSSSTGIPPQTDPDFLQDSSVIAFTRLNELTPLMPLTQTQQVRGPLSTQTFVTAYNDPRDLYNSPNVTYNDNRIRYEVRYPDDVLYSGLEVVERATGTTDLLAPACDSCDGPTFTDIGYTQEVCLTYDGTALPENTAGPTPWERVDDNPAQVVANAFAGELTYGTLGATKTIYRNVTPLPDSIGLVTAITFRVKIVQDTTLGLGDSQIRLGFSSAPNMTVAVAFVTTPPGDRYVYVKDLNNGAIIGGLLFDWYDGAYHTYRLTKDPAFNTLTLEVDP